MRRHLEVGNIERGKSVWHRKTSLSSTRLRSPTMASRMRPRVQFNDRDLWGVYHGYLRSHSRWLHKDDEDGQTEETLGLLEYALGYPLARARKWLSQAPSGI